MSHDWTSLRQDYERDGVIHLPGFFDAESLGAARAAYEWSLANPGPGALKFAQETDATFYQDLYNPRCLEAYGAMLRASPIPGLLANLWGRAPVWFMYEQVFLKEGGEARRTPWHQDASYLAIEGADAAVAWITFDPVAKEDSLEFIRGSHRGPLYNGSRFELGDDTAPLHPHSTLPKLPDIEAARDEWDILSWPVEPGDLVLFHMNTMHGGAPTHAGKRRRTLTLRFFGEDAFYAARDGRAGPVAPGFHERMKPGDRFRDPAFLQLRG